MAWSPRKKVLRRLFGCLLLLVLAALIGPALAGRYATAWIVSQILPELSDRIEVESIDLSWTEPVVIRGITVRDDRGRLLADVPEIKTDYALGDWIRRPRRLGTIEVVRPRVTMRRDADGWGIERLVAALQTRPKGEPVVSVAIKVTDAKVVVSNEARKTEIELDRLQSQIAWERGETEDGLQAALQGDLSVEQVTTTVDGSAKPWDVPLQVTADLRWGDGAVTLRSLRANMPFGSLRAAGDRRQGELRATVDMTTLQTLLGGVLFPEVERMEGRGAVAAVWSPDGDATSVKVTGEIAPFKLVQPPNVALDATRWQWKAAGRVTPSQATSTDDPESWLLASASIELDCDGDQLRIASTDPIRWRGTATKWPIEAHLQGSIGSWIARWNALAGAPRRLPASAGSFSGKAAITVAGLIDHEHVAVDRGSAKGTDFAWSRGEQTWSEPVWNVEVSKLRWNGDPMALEADRIIIQTSAVSARFQGLSWDRAGGGLGLRGAGSLRAQLDQVVTRLRRVGWTKTDDMPRGQLVAKWVFRSDGSGEHMEGTVDVDKLTWLAAASGSSASAGSHREIPIGRVHVDFRGMRESVGTWRAEKLAAAVGDGLGVDLSGYWKVASPARPFALTGTYSYDLARIRAWWPELSDEVRFSGRHTQPIGIKGEWPVGRSWREAMAESWRGSAELAWDHVESFGFRAGPGSTRIRLEAGVLAADRTTIRWEGGGAVVEPRFLFARVTPTIELVPPTRVDRLSLTPAMCRAWLQYVLPLSADAASAEGQLSLDVARFRMPIGRVETADVEGTLTVHQGKIGPSKEVRGAFAVLQLAQLLKPRDAERARADWIELPPQQIACRLQQGKVFHRGLRMRVGPFDLSSRGQVGLDESIDVMLVLRFDDRLTRNQPLLAGLRGRDIEVPLQGTLKKPRLKAEAVQSITRGLLLQGPADELLRRGLESLFKP